MKPDEPQARASLPVTPPVPEDILPRPLGRYELVRRVGSGSMGVVYAALDRDSGRTIALKTLHQLDPGALFRLKNEFRSAAGLSHPNLVSLHQLVSHDDEWFITMEFVDGVSFVDHVRQGMSEKPGAAPPPERLRPALLQLAAGVSALHAAGKLHRDLKSSNVLVTADGRVVILDFGLAADNVAEGGEDGLLGTPATMAPEQAAGNPASPASDWYAIGVMLYEALTGRLPFTGPPLAILHAKQHEDPAPPQALVPNVDPELATLCVGLLQRDPAARLGGADIREALGEAPLGPTESGARFVGRDDLLSAMRDAFQLALAGSPVCVYVRGRSGIGKTALIDRFIAELRRNDRAFVLQGRCYERESVPYKAFDSVLDALAQHLRHLPQEEAAALLPREIHELTRLFPVLARAPVVADLPQRNFVAPDPQEARRRAFRGLKELLARIADRRPLVLRIADLQWGDEDSARLLAELLSPPDPPAMLFIGSYRIDEDDAPMLRELRRLGARPELKALVRDLLVEPLSPDQAEELALARLGRDSDSARAEARRIAAESGGNPLFVEELARHIAGHRGAAPAEVSLDAVVRTRLANLRAAGRSLLEIVAVAGRPIPPSLAFTASGVTDRSVLGELQAQHLLRTLASRSGDTVECYHDRIRDTVLAQLGGDRLAQLHRTLADALAQSADDPELLAHHLHAAGALKEAHAAAVAAAERAAAALAFYRAAQLYGRALAWAPDLPDDERRALLRRRADALALAGRSAEAAPVYASAAEGASAAESLELRRRAGEQFLVSGNIDQGVRMLRPALVEVDLGYPATPGRANMSIITRSTQLSLRGLGFAAVREEQVPPADLLRLDVCLSAAVGLAFVDPIRGYSFYQRGLLLALQTGEPQRIARALAGVGAMIMSRGTANAVGRGTTLLKEARRLAEQISEPRLIGLCEIVDAIAAVSLGRWRRALEHCEQGAQILLDRCVGVGWELDLARMSTMRGLFMLGELAELGHRAHAWLRESEDAGDLCGEVWSALYSAYALLGADDITSARDRVRGAMRRWSKDGFHFQHMLALILETSCDLYQGQGGSAWQRLAENWVAVENSYILGWQGQRILFLHARGLAAIAAAREQPHNAGVLLAAAERDAAQLEEDRALRHDSVAMAALIRAGIAAQNGDIQQALVRLEAAAASFDTADMPVHAACARRRRGELLGPSGATLIAQADQYLASRAILRPAQWSAMYNGSAPT
ncbi:protein kinase domain-containing protein [Nannocystis pusilla]|uniref:protein kinase domain-containing protein n=1 Tax=Nannocystis pusilla TaxID=889268 RepID=UPI003DA2CDBD